MSTWIQSHLWQATVFVVLYLLLAGLWRLSKLIWRRRPQGGRMATAERNHASAGEALRDYVHSHPHVTHPGELLAVERTRLAQVNDWLATHLAIVFGLVWTVWLFMVFPLVVLLLPKGVQNITFYLASGWIQLWALPLFIYVGNRLQKSSDAQSDAQHVALSHIASKVDEHEQRLDANTELTEKTHALVKDLHVQLSPPAPPEGTRP